MNSADELLIEKAQRLREARIVLARQDPNTFMRLVLKDEMSGDSIDQARHHVEWHKLISTHERLVIWSSVEHGKTQQISIGRVLWELGVNPASRIAVVSNTHEQAGKIVRTIARYIEQSEELRLVFPHLRKGEPWTAHHLFVEGKGYSKDPSIQACGVHGNIMGARLDLLILDDILDFENCRTKSGRQDLWEWYHSVLPGRMSHNSRIVAIGTAFHPDDTLHRFGRLPMWESRLFPVLNEEGEPLWPERWPKDRVQMRKLELGPLEFARQMMCQARDDSEARCKKEWIELCLDRGDGWPLFDSLDLAI